MSNKEKEIRKVVVDNIEVRTNEANEYLLEGYINKFNTRSQFMGFYEEVDKHAFDRTLADGHTIMALYNHDPDKVLGSTKSGSLSLSVDEVGLRFSLKVNPNVSYANDVYELVKTGDIDGCSFGFYTNEDEWRILEDGSELRILKDVHLIEVTITPYPAYLSSEASCRSYDEFKAKQQDIETRKLLKEKLELELELF